MPSRTNDFLSLLKYSNIGRSVPAPAGGRDLKDGAQQSILSIEGPNDFSQPMTVTLSNEPEVSGASAGIGRANVWWGGGGIQSGAQVDFINGASFVVSGSFLRISIVRNEVVAGEPVLARFGAHVSYLPNTNPIPPQLTIDQDDLVVGTGPFPLFPAGTALFDLPSYSAQLRFVREPIDIVCELAFLNAALTVVYRISIPAGENLITPIPITNQVRFVQLQNLGVDNITSCKLIHELNL